VINEIYTEHYYEEEDFLTNTFTQDLLTNIEVADIQVLINDAIDSLLDLDLSETHCRAIRQRMEARRSLLDAMTPWQVGSEFEKSSSWKSVLDLVPSLSTSHDLGIPVTSAFSERVQRYLASNAPPRPMIETTWIDAMKDLQSLCENTLEAYRLGEVALTMSPPALMVRIARFPHLGRCIILTFGLQRFVWNFASRTPPPSTYSRAVIQGLMFKGGAVAGRLLHMDLLVTDLRDHVMAGDIIFDPTNWEIELPSDPRYQVARKVDEFLNKAMEVSITRLENASSTLLIIARNTLISTG